MKQTMNRQEVLQKRIAPTALALVLLCALAACSPKETVSPLAGIWYGEEVAMDIDAAGAVTMLDSYGDTMTGTSTVKGETVTITIDGESVSGTMKGDDLKLEEDGETLNLERVLPLGEDPQEKLLWEGVWVTEESTDIGLGFFDDGTMMIMGDADQESIDGEYELNGVWLDLTVEGETVSTIYTGKSIYMQGYEFINE